LARLEQEDYAMALHEQSVGATDEWYTPVRVFDALGCTFDIDVASPGRERTPWIPARAFITENSLATAWDGFVWMNPPFGPRNGIVPWLAKFFTHGNGIALVPDRTSAPWWQAFAVKAELILFTAGKLKFISANGAPGNSPAQGTTLLAIGQQGCEALRRAADRGLGLLMSPNSCLGFLFHHGEHEVEAFDRDCNSLGTFPSQKAAATAVFTMSQNTGANNGR
jgi:hypothetical protein